LKEKKEKKKREEKKQLELTLELPFCHHPLFHNYPFSLSFTLLLQCIARTHTHTIHKYNTKTATPLYQYKYFIPQGPLL
jgi:hypothetical protein